MSNKKKIAMVVGYNPEVDRDAVGQYAEQLYSNIKLIANKESVDLIRFIPNSNGEWFTGLKKIFADYDLIHIQYPVENWGHSIWPGVYPGVLKSIMKRDKRLVFTFHEWGSMHPLRKASIIPVAIKSDGIVFVSNNEQDKFGESKVSRYNRKQETTVIPIGVNLKEPNINYSDVLERRELLLDNKFDVLIGYFGFIYDWKQPYKMLHAIKSLHSIGIKAKLIIAGDFPADHKLQKQKFLDEIENLGLQDFVEYLGFVEDEDELATVLSCCNLILMLFSDGVSARRSSFWYVLGLGVPVITTHPVNHSEFKDLLDLDSLVESKRVKLIDIDESADNLALTVKDFMKEFALPEVDLSLAPSWEKIAENHIDFYRDLLNVK